MKFRLSSLPFTALAALIAGLTFGAPATAAPLISPDPDIPYIREIKDLEPGYVFLPRPNLPRRGCVAILRNERRARAKELKETTGLNRAARRAAARRVVFSYA